LDCIHPAEVYGKWREKRSSKGSIKSLIAGELFKRYPEIKKRLLGGHFWSDGGYIGTVSDNVWADDPMLQAMPRCHSCAASNDSDMNL
jgi:hypothetical protein